MSETKSTRSPIRAYLQADGVIEFRKAGATTILKVTDLTVGAQIQASVEGIIDAYQHGATLEDIQTGAAFPDRSPPKVKEAKVEAPTEPSALVKAIAVVRMADSGGPEWECLAWAEALSPAQREAVRKGSYAVKAELKRIRGKYVSLDALVGGGAPAAGDEMDEAAD